MLLDILLSPALLLSLVVALLYGAIFHLWQGRTLRDLGRFILASLLGFAAGQALSLIIPFQWLVVGQVHLFEGTVCALLALFIANRLKV